MQKERAAPTQALSMGGARILLIEDEYYIADDVRRALSAAGAEVVGPVSTLDRAAEAVERDDFDCALVGLNLHGESAVPIADRLLARGKSFAIATGYGSASVPERLKSVPRAEKPFDPQTLVNVLGSLGCAQPRESVD